MSSLTALLLLGALPSGDAAPDTPPALFPPVRLSAEEAIANERSMIVAPPVHCGTAPEGEIVVCGHRRGDLHQRLPLPDQRAEPGEIVRHAGEADATGAFNSHSCARPGSCEPPRLMDTIFKSVGALVHAIRGEEATVPPYP